MPLSVDEMSRHRQLKFDLVEDPLQAQPKRYIGVVVSKKHMKTVVVHNVLKIAWGNFEYVHITRSQGEPGHAAI